MAKVDISLTRSLTINTGNYESIKPTVTISVRDVDPSKLGDLYQNIDEVLTGLIKFEILACAGEGKMVNSGIDQYCKGIVRNSATIGSEIDVALGKIEEY